MGKYILPLPGTGRFLSLIGALQGEGAILIKWHCLVPRFPLLRVRVWLDCAGRISILLFPKARIRDYSSNGKCIDDRNKKENIFQLHPLRTTCMLYDPGEDPRADTKRCTSNKGGCKPP